MKHRTALWAILPIFALAACGDDDGGIIGTPEDPEATVRFVNATTDAGAVSFSAGGSAVASDVAFGQSSQCQVVDAGSTKLAFTAAGSTTPADSVVMNLQDEGVYTMVALGSSASPSILFLTDSFTPPAPDRARLRVINASPTTGAVDVFVTEEDGELTTPAIANLAFNATQAFLDVPAGSTQVRFAAPATTDPILFDTGAFGLTAGQVHTVVLTEAEDGTLGFAAVDVCN